MDRLQTDFENAWCASCKAVEGIALLLLSILIVGLQTCLKGLTPYIDGSIKAAPGWCQENTPGD